MCYTPLTISAELRARAMSVHERLCEAYKCPIPYFRDQDPLSELVAAMLNHRTRDAIASRAFRALREAYKSWEEVRDAPVADLQALIKDVTWPEMKAPRLQQTLREITRRIQADPNAAGLFADEPRLTLDFLGEMPLSQARKWLEALPGVGPKTSAAVMAFSNLRRAALVVDTHHHRVATRLGLLPEGLDLGPAHTWLEQLVPRDFNAQQVYDHHEVFLIHGKRTCFARNPACQRCPILDLCPTGRARLEITPRLRDRRSSA